MSELMEIAKRYTEEDPSQDSDDELGGKLNRRNIGGDGRRDDCHFSGKRRGDGGSELVANASYGQRDPKSSRRDNRAPREDHPPGKRFSAEKLLDAPCIYHSREGKPATHTTANCYSLMQIEKARHAKENATDD